MKSNESFNEIMKKIHSGLTGDWNKDKAYLDNQMKVYKDHELGTEILRACGRLLFDIMPDDLKSEIENAVEKDENRISSILDEVRFNIHKKNYNKAQSLMELLVKEADKNPMYQNDEVSEYFTFFEPFEEMLYLYLYEPTKVIRKAEFPYAEIYYQQGSLFIDLKRYEDAIEVLEKAKRWNPCNAKIAFEYAEAYKTIGQLEKYLEITRETFNIAFRAEDFARALRNVGYYLIEKEQYQDAFYFYCLSLRYDEKSINAQSELYYISSMVQNKLKDPSWDDIESCGKKYNIPIKPSDDIVGIALAHGQNFFKNKNYDIALYCVQIAYELTGEEELKGILDSIESFVNSNDTE